MSSIEQIFEQYAEAFRSGETDPRPFLRHAPENERDELGKLIELFLMQTDPQEWDPDEFADSDAARMTERILPEILAPERGWSEMLPALRIEQKKSRGQISRMLAAALGVKSPEQAERVRDYYHDMEYGNLKPQGVSRQVLDSLADIYGTTVEILKRAGERTLPADDGGVVVYARTLGDADQAIGMASPGKPEFRRISGKPDWIDRLFTGTDFDDFER